LGGQSEHDGRVRPPASHPISLPWRSTPHPTHLCRLTTGGQRSCMRVPRMWWAAFSPKISHWWREIYVEAREAGSAPALRVHTAPSLLRSVCHLRTSAQQECIATSRACLGLCGWLVRVRGGVGDHVGASLSLPVRSHTHTRSKNNVHPPRPDPASPHWAGPV
jgi:hypothetical protein